MTSPKQQDGWDEGSTLIAKSKKNGLRNFSARFLVYLYSLARIAVQDKRLYERWADGYFRRAPDHSAAVFSASRFGRKAKRGRSNYSNYYQ